MENKKEGEHTLWDTLYIIYNATEEEVETALPKGEWEVLLNEEDSFAWKKQKKAEKATAAPLSALVLGRRGCI